MSDQLRPDEAAQALEEIRERQGQVIALAVLPTWYWWAVGTGMVVLAIGVDIHTATSIGISVTVFVLGILAATGRVTIGAFRHAQLRNDLLGAQGVLAILAFIAAIIAITLGLAFTLRAAHVSYPATIACAVGGLAMGSGGPVLTRLLYKIMLSNRDGAAG
jgi:hypothetical protein